MPEMQGPYCHDYGIRGFGNPDFGVVVVGIAPGRDEAERTHRPFTGQSGKLLDQLLEYSGWHRNKVYTTNTICWWNNAPLQAEIELCMPRFQRELTDLKPRLIITAGAIANETVMGAKRHKGSRGSVLWSDRWNCYILDTHHPSFALQAQSMSAAQDIIRDFAKIPDILKWPDNAEHARVTYATVTSIEQAQKCLSELPILTPVTLDIETSNPDPELIDAYSDQLLCFSVSIIRDRQITIVFPARIFPRCVTSGQHVRAYRSAGGCDQCALPRNVFEWPMGVQWAFQAGQYDIVGLHEFFDVTLPLVDDTMLMSMCTDERPGYHGLKANAREYLGAGFYNEEVKRYYNGRLNELPEEKLFEYNAKDAAYTARWLPMVQSRMINDGTDTLYRDLLLPATRCFIAQQIRGINVDQRRLQELAYLNWFPKWLKDQKALQIEAHALGWPTDDINVNSSQQLGKLFFEILGVEVYKYTKGGKPSVDKETLDQMDHPFAASLRAFRQLDTIIDYVFSVFNNLKYDGLLHPNAYVTTTRTGRTSYRDPAMQTIPKDYTLGEDYARLREAIIPHNPDTHEIIEGDFNQIEVWLAWAESHDPTLLEHLESGDVHSRTAEGAFNTRQQDHTPLEWAAMRQNAKRIRFGLQYGEGAKKLSTPQPVGMGCSIAEAQRFVNNFWRTYPQHRAWVDRTQRLALSQGYLRTPTGRVMRFPIVLDHKELRQAINFPIQGNATDANLLSMIELQEALKPYNSFIILNIHDNLTVESDRRYRAEVIALMHEIMERPKWDGCPRVKVDIKVGDNLGAVKKV